MKFQKNRKYLYACYGHPAITDKDGRYYCRARHFIMDDDFFLCKDCPLFGGSFEYDGGSCPECWYFDLDTESDGEKPINADEAMKKEEGLVNGGFVSLFPQYLFDSRGERFDIIERALIFAAEKHKGQVRKGSLIPYISHPIETSMIVAKMDGDPETIAAAALHDTLEDTDTSYEELSDNFGKRVADLVQCESENKRKNRPSQETWKIRKQETLDKAASEPIEARKIMLADKLSNMRQTMRSMELIGGKVWDRFNIKDPKLHEWYHRGILKSMSELKDYDAYKEYRDLIEKVFKGSGEK